MTYSRTDKMEQLEKIQEWAESRAVAYNRMAGEARAHSDVLKWVTVNGVTMADAARTMLEDPIPHDMGAVEREAYEYTLKGYLTP